MTTAPVIPNPDRVPTGIDGIDRMLYGGLLVGGIYLLVGPPSAGKTILANHIVYDSVRRGVRALYATVLGETHTRLLGHIRQFTFFDQQMVGTSISYISGYRIFREQGLQALGEQLQSTIRRQDMSFLVVDGLPLREPGNLIDSATDDFLHDLQVFCELTHCTALILVPETQVTWESHAFMLIDGALELDRRVEERTITRTIEVRKFRGSRYQPFPHQLVIDTDGVSVFAPKDTGT